MEDNPLAINGTLFQVGHALPESGSAALQTEVELQLKMYFQKDQDQRHILKEPSNRIVSAFRLFVDEPMLRSILKFTIKHGQADDASFSVELRELEKFIGLQIARGVLVGKNTQIRQLWSREWGHPIFAKAISRDRYKELMKHLRFDNFSTRHERIPAHKFYLI